MCSIGPRFSKLLEIWVCPGREGSSLGVRGAAERGTGKATRRGFHSPKEREETSYDYWGGSRFEDSCLAR